MARIVLSVLLSCLSLGCFAEASGDSITVERLLVEASRQKADTNWMLWFADKFMGVPYVAHTLDLDSEENLVVNTREMDCTTFVETVVALSKCRQYGATTFADYKRWLAKVRYIDGEVAYVKRKHYFTTWMEENERQGITTTIETMGEPFTAVQNLKCNFMSTHVDKYSMLKLHHEWIDGIRAMEKAISGRAYHYIPKTLLTRCKSNGAMLRNVIHDGDILAIITSIGGLDTSHIGLAHWKKDGLHLINASSVHHKVVDEPMLLHTYMQRHPKQLGIRIARVSAIQK